MGQDLYFYGWVVGVGGWEQKWGLKLTSAKVEVEVEAELGKIIKITICFLRNPVNGILEQSLLQY